MFKIAQFLIVGLAASCQAGILSDSLIKSFTSGDPNKDVIVEFPSVLDAVMASSSLSGLTGNDRSNEIVSLLQLQTKVFQAPFIASLSALGINEDQVTPFWADNKFAIKGAGLGPLQAFAALPGAFTVREPFKANAIEGVPSTDRISLRQTTSAQWGVAKINAPAVWKSGNTGKGVVVGIIDSGVNVDHEALTSNYLNTSDSWLDAFNEYDTPYDGNGHGTHCAGTIAGNVNGIGVAPDAKYIACRGLNDKGSGSEITLTACGQFMACPGNSTGTCTGMPDIVSNSWGGSGGQSWFNKVIQLWQNIGIIPVFALGNSGPACFTAGSPGDQPNLISVGSTEADNGISSFSSRGPAVFGLKTKPEVAAPGRNIVSADNTNKKGYKALSGTSMATPHVAGAIALMLSAHPDYTYANVTKALESTAVKPKLGFFDSLHVCSIPAAYPNNGYGNGIIDIAKALKIVSN